MSQQHDISPTMHDPRTQSASDYTFREMLERYYAESPGSNTEKLENFAKYVPRQNLARFKIPKKVVFGPVPTTATGKIQKYVLRERAKGL